jgi:hypothetical protein
MKWIVGVAIAAVVMIVGFAVVGSYGPQVEQLSSGIDIVKKVAGLVVSAAGLITFAQAANANAGGIRGLTTSEASGPGVLTIAGAILLAA